MKKLSVVLIFFACGILPANDYKWDFVNALTKNDFTTVENIIKENINSMSAPEKRLMMNFSLSYSYGQGAITALNILERHDIHPNSFDLYTALNRNQPNEVIQLLLDKGVQPNGEILLLAMEKKRFDLAERFIEMDCDVNYHYPLSASYADGMTPLLYASKWNNFDLVEKLVERGAAVNARDKNGNTALSAARANNNSQIADFLAERGAIETTAAGYPPPQNSGIFGFLDGPAVTFQTGTYRLFGGAMDMRFYGNSNSGSISYVRNGVINSGVYRVAGNILSLGMEGRTMTYRLDSGESFSGNGEVWVRMGN